MGVKHNHCKIEIPIKNLIKETDSAAQRTRWTIIALILVTGIVGIGFYNSTYWSFTTERLKALSSFENTSVNNSVGSSEKPLLDSYFGENDFKNTHFPVGFFEFYQTKNFSGLKGFVCDDIYKHKDSTSQNGKEAIGKYLYDSLNSETKNLVETECKPNPNKPEEFVFADYMYFRFLTNDLNKILKDKYLFNRERFDFLFSIDSPNQTITNYEELKNILNSWETDKNPNDSEMESSQKKVDIVRLNRLLLEAAFHDKILPSKDIIPSHEAIKAKEFSKHFAFDDNVQFIDLPFFGSAIDVNDLGIVGGISLIVVLLLLRFSLSREIKNLNLSFKQAFYNEKLDYFYHLLAMKQVLTIPEMAGEEKNQTLTASSKLIFLFPVIVISFGVGYDFYSIFYYRFFDPRFVLTHLILESICVVIVIYLSGRCLERQMHIDEIWEEYDEILNYYRKHNSTVKAVESTDDSAESEKLTFEFCKEIAENPNKLLSEAFRDKREKDSDALIVHGENKEVLEIVKKRFANVPPPDKSLIVSLFLPQNLARLIPSKRIAQKVARFDLTVYRKVFIASLCLLLISLIVQYFGKPLFSQSMVADDIKDLFIIIAAIGTFFGGIGTIVSAYVNFKKENREKIKDNLPPADPPDENGNQATPSDSDKSALPSPKEAENEKLIKRTKSKPKNRKPGEAENKSNEEENKVETKDD